MIKNDKGIVIGLKPLAYFSKFISSETAPDVDNYFDLLHDQIEWTKVQFRKGVNLPRLVQKYDRPLTIQNGVPEVLIDLKNQIETVFETDVHGIWCNLYESGKDWTPPHKDDYGSDVFTLSFGGSRVCNFIPDNVNDSKYNKKISYTLNDGDLLYFSPLIDSKHKHTIPKTTKKVDPRISIVFFTDKPYSNRNKPSTITNHINELNTELPIEILQGLLRQMFTSIGPAIHAGMENISIHDLGDIGDIDFTD